MDGLNINILPAVEPEASQLHVEHGMVGPDPPKHWVFLVNILNN